jgi:ubiquinone/menaquinone biosynthesis C-methylase UbiE
MERARLLSYAEAERFYDIVGAMLDTQSFYEAPALRALADHLDLPASRAVVEFGCGTGRFAAELLENYMPLVATYLGVDISSRMVALTKSRLGRFGSRAQALKSKGTPHIDSPPEAFDRFICTYVLDLLSENDIRAELEEAQRVLVPDGLMGLVSLTNGPTPASRVVSTLWSGLHTMSPWLAGGCRPIELTAFISASAWAIEFRQIVMPFGVPSEVVAARKRRAPQGSSS